MASSEVHLPHSLSLTFCFHSSSRPRNDPSKGEDSFSENHRKYLASEVARHEKQQAWADTITKPKTPTPTSALGQNPFRSPISAGPMILSSLSEDVESRPPPSLDAETQTQSTLQSKEDEVADRQRSNSQQGEEKDGKDPTKPSSVFSSLYGKAAQVFPISRPSTSSSGLGAASSVTAISHRSMTSHYTASRAGMTDLPPHSEHSYHSIVSHQESKEAGAIVPGII
jgi:hypothetical protein